MVWSGQRRTVRMCPLKKVRIDNPDFFLFLLLLLPIFNLEIWSELSATPLFRIENRAVTRLFSLHVVTLFCRSRHRSATPPRCRRLVPYGSTPLFLPSRSSPPPPPPPPAAPPPPAYMDTQLQKVDHHLTSPLWTSGNWAVTRDGPSLWLGVERPGRDA